jgi:sulfoxide reductase catalytic subunit YedY
MLIKKASDIRSSEITPKSVYLKRREFIQAGSAALAGAGVAAAGWNAWGGDALAQGGGLPKLPNVKKSPLSTTEAPSSYDNITSYNNFYEFAPGAGDGPKKNSGKFKATPWSIEVDGLCNKPGKYNLEDFIKPFALEERIYRFRLRRGVVLCHPLGGHPAVGIHQASRAAGQGAVHRDDHAGGSGPFSDAADRPPRVAI